MRSGGTWRIDRGPMAVAVTLALGLAALTAPVDVAAMQPGGGTVQGVVPGTEAEASKPLFDWRAGALWLGTAPGRGLTGADAAPPSLLLDLHPLDSGFRLSLGPGLERAPDPLSPAFGTGAGPGGLYDPSWYMGLGWTGSLGGRVSLFVDIGAAYAEHGPGLGAGVAPPPVVFDLQDESALARSDDDPLSRLLPMLSVSFAYRF